MTYRHVYPSLRIATRAVVRIYGPIERGDIIRWLKGLNHHGQIAGVYRPESVPQVLTQLEADGEVESCADRWWANSGKIGE